MGCPRREILIGSTADACRLRRLATLLPLFSRRCDGADLITSDLAREPGQFGGSQVALKHRVDVQVPQKSMTLRVILELVRDGMRHANGELPRTAGPNLDESDDVGGNLIDLAVPGNGDTQLVAHAIAP
jgi:hypothetical protein